MTPLCIRIALNTLPSIILDCRYLIGSIQMRSLFYLNYANTVLPVVCMPLVLSIYDRRIYANSELVANINVMLEIAQISKLANTCQNYMETGSESRYYQTTSALLPQLMMSGPRLLCIQALFGMICGGNVLSLSL